MMNQDIKKQWIDALRSGKFTRGIRELRTIHPVGESHCCLGVLTHLYCKAHGISEGTFKGMSYPPDEVVSWSGLPDSNPAIMLPEPEQPKYLHTLNLAWINDNRIDPTDKTYGPIPDLIEKQL